MNEDGLRSRSNNNNDLIVELKDGIGNNEDEGDNLPKKVQVSAMFKKMGEIDTAKECFTAEVILQAKWRERSLDGATEEDIKRVDFSQLWNPKLNVSNLLTEQKDVTSYNVIFPANDDRLAYVLWQKRLKGCFMENLELQMFPFDIQDLTVTLTSELTSTHVQFVADSESVVNTRSFVDEQEWKLRSKVRTEVGQSEELVIGGRSFGRRYPFLNFKCTAERRYQYFLWNFAFILFFICLMCLAIFAVECKFPQNRLQLTFILLLTTVAFKSNINNLLPKISYLTLMDKYFLGAWVIQCLMCIWHSVVGSLLLKNPKVVEIDWGFLALFSLVVVVFQAFCVWYAFKKLRNKKRAFDKLEGLNDRQDESGEQRPLQPRNSTTNYSTLKEETEAGNKIKTATANDSST